MVVIKENPFQWLPSSDDIVTRVFSFALASQGEELHVDNLSQPIDIFLPQDDAGVAEVQIRLAAIEVFLLMEYLDLDTALRLDIVAEAAGTSIGIVHEFGSTCRNAVFSLLMIVAGLSKLVCYHKLQHSVQHIALE